MGSTFLGLLIAPSVCAAQSEGQAQPQPRSQSSAQPGRTSDQTSCSDRERALLERIRSLEDRLAKVESTLSGTAGAARPNPSSQTSVVQPCIPDQNSLGSITAPDNTQIRLGDSLLLFQTGSLAPGVTVQKANYHLTAADAGIKYRGFWLQGEGYYQLLDDFLADGPLPLGKIRDFGFYVQSSYMVVPKKVEFYGATSYVFSPMGNSHEFLEGVNYYFANVRNYRINLQVIEVNRSPTSSQFGFYVGGLRGTIIALGATVFF